MCSPNNSVTTVKASGLHASTLCNMEHFWKALRNLTMLIELDLSSNHIKALPFDVFSQQGNLKTLNLSGNSLVVLTFTATPMQYLEVLDLSDNNIQYASKPFTSSIGTHGKGSELAVLLNGNGLLCDCDRSHFVLWLRNTKSIYNKDSLMCKYRNGSQVSLRNIAKVYDQLNADCIFELVITSCVVGFFGLLLVAGLVALAYYKRWHFQYLLTMGMRKVNPYHPLEERHIELEYDIYISYERDYDVTPNETLHEFVTKRLYPWFQHRGLKVLIRDELDIGKRLYDVISKALRKSKKVIVLLSNNYCVDYWNVFEFNMAVMEGIYTKRQMVIPITFETLLVTNFHEEIVSFLRSEPASRYTRDTKFSVLAEYLLDRVG